MIFEITSKDNLHIKRAKKYWILPDSGNKKSVFWSKASECAKKLLKAEIK